MGLDQYIFRVSKPNLEDRVYKSEELAGFDRTAVVDFERNSNLYKQLIPYVVKRNVEVQLYDTAKMIVDYHLPSNSYIWKYGGEGIEIGGRDEEGNHISQAISEAEVAEKYTKTEIHPYYIWSSDEEWYWRKNYALAEWMSNNIKNGTENTGYYKLNKTLIKRINSKFSANIPEESATEESALFYWEWY